LEPFRKIDVGKVILKIEFLDGNSLAICDETSKYKVLEQKRHEGSFIYTSKFGINVPKLNSQSPDLLSTSANKNLFAYYDSDDKQVKVLDFEAKKLFFKVESNRGTSEVLTFDRNNRYLAVGGQNGRVGLFACASGQLLYNLSSHKDFVSSIEFAPSNKRIATGGYDREIHIFDLRKMEQISVLKHRHQSAIKFMKFFSLSMIATIDQHGAICVWDYKMGGFKFSLRRLSGTPVFAFIIDDRYLVALGNDGYACLYDLESKKVLNQKYIYVPDGVRSAAFDEDNNIFFIATMKGTVLCFNLLEGREDLISSVTSRDFKNAYMAISSNPILEHMEPYAKILDEIWDDTVKEAITYLEQEDEESAKNILMPFADIASKANFIHSLTTQYKDFEKFRVSIEKQNYALSYSMIQKHPSYRESAIFEGVQKEWERCINDALVVLSSNREDVEGKINAIFENFRGISEKLEFIRDINEKKVILSIFNKADQNENFSECFALAEENIFLKDLEAYRNLTLKEKIIFDAMNAALETSDFENAKSFAMQLILFPLYKVQANEILRDINKTSTFRALYREKDFKGMLNMVDKYHFLENLPEMKQFIKSFEDRMLVAENYSLKGNIAKVMEVINLFMPISSLHERMGKIVSSAYIQQLYFLVRKYPDRNDYILNGLNNYVDIFGLDDNLLVYVDFLRSKLGLSLNQDDFDSRFYKPDYSKWSKIQLPSRIF